MSAEGAGLACKKMELHRQHSAFRSRVCCAKGRQEVAPGGLYRKSHHRRYHMSRQGAGAPCATWERDVGSERKRIINRLPNTVSVRSSDTTKCGLSDGRTIYNSHAYQCTKYRCTGTGVPIIRRTYISTCNDMYPNITNLLIL